MIAYFRTTDKTSDAIGTRQASVFRVFAGLAGYGDPEGVSKTKNPPKARASQFSKINTKKESAPKQTTSKSAEDGMPSKEKDMALTVRIEINLPSDGTKETYDSIFQSIKANLL